MDAADMQSPDDDVGVFTVSAWIFLIFASAFLGAIIPVLKLSSTKQNTIAGVSTSVAQRAGLQQWFRVGNAFAAGFLVAAALVHVLPDAAEDLDDAYPHLNFPLASAIAIGGACCMLLLDVLMREHMAADHGPQSRRISQSGKRRRRLPSSLCPTPPSPTSSTFAPIEAVLHKDQLPTDPWVGHRAGETGRLARVTRVPRYSSFSERVLTMPPLDTRSSDSTQDVHYKVTLAFDDAFQPSSSTTPLIPKPAVANSSYMQASSRPPNSSSIVALVLLAALSFHSVMEGLALGASRPSRKQFLGLLIAVLAHKFFAALALGFSLAQSCAAPLPESGSAEAEFKARRRTAILAGLGFALSTPIGAAIGVLLSTNLLPQAARVMSAVLSSFSAGIFLFVAFVELLGDDEAGHDEMNPFDTHPVADEHDGDAASHAGPPTDAARTLLQAVVFTGSAAAMSALALWV